MKTDVNSPPVPPTIDSHSAVAKSLDALIAEQGVGPLERFEDLFGAARDWWTDEEFATFLTQLQTTRCEQG